MIWLTGGAQIWRSSEPRIGNFLEKFAMVGQNSLHVKREMYSATKKRTRKF